MAERKETFTKPVRIYELARRFDVPNKDLITWLQERGHDVSTHSNTLPPEVATQVAQEWYRSHDKKSKNGQKADEQPTEREREQTPPESTETPRSRPEPTRERPAERPTPPPRRSERPPRSSRSDSSAERRSSSRSNRVAYSSRMEGRDSTRTYHSPSSPQRDGRDERRRGTIRTRERAPQRDRRGPGPDRRRGDRPDSPRGPGRPTEAVVPPGEQAEPARSRHRAQKEREREREERRERAEREERDRLLRPSKSEKTEEIALPKRDEIIEIEEESTVGQIAEQLGIRATVLIAHLFKMGIMATINQPLSREVMEQLEEPFHFVTTKRRTLEERLLERIEIEDDPDSLEPRAPVVTIMGHVDHGKTTLLDAVRETNVADREAGQITQHIGAYNVMLENGRVVFLDTPGHEAFTAMRARGAQVTDVVVLVVAADDGVMPQTVEAINHAKAAGVPIVVAVNKIDLPNANPDRVKSELAELGLTPEEWGGQTVFVEVSAKQRIGIEELLEYLALESELLELKANPNRPAVGTVIESKLDRGRGPVATVLVQNGTLRVGDHFVAGSCHGRVRALITDRGDRVEEAGPSTPVEVLGFNAVPAPGERFLVLSEEDARTLAEERRMRARAERLAKTHRITLEEIHEQIQQGKVNELNIIVKADVEGSIEAIRSALEKFDSDEVRVVVIHSGVGAITETDVMLAAASNAVILGFTVRPTPEARRAADREGVDIRTYNVIYEMVNDIRSALEGLLEPEVRERVLGRATVREVFRAPRYGLAAGVYVNNGRIVRGMKLRVLRDNRVVHEGTVDSIRRFKEDVTEVAAGYECGVAMQNFNDFKIDDVLECYTFEEVARTLEDSGDTSSKR